MHLGRPGGGMRGELLVDVPEGHAQSREEVVLDAVVASGKKRGTCLESFWPSGSICCPASCATSTVASSPPLSIIHSSRFLLPRAQLTQSRSETRQEE